jgi:hypothetical protein
LISGSQALAGDPRFAAVAGMGKVEDLEAVGLENDEGLTGDLSASSFGDSTILMFWWRRRRRFYDHAFWDEPSLRTDNDGQRLLTIFELGAIRFGASNGRKSNVFGGNSKTNEQSIQ